MLSPISLLPRDRAAADFHRCSFIITLFRWFALLAMTPAAAIAASTLLLGTQQIGAQLDSNQAGVAEAFQANATASGSLASIVVYVDSSSTANKVVVGVYADSGGKPGLLLGQGTLNAPAKGGWNTVALPSISLTAGVKYWIAVLGPAGSGTLSFRDVSIGSRSETSSVTTLSTLPGTWRTGKVYSNSPLSAYGITAGSTQPILVVPTAPLSFSATQGGTDPAAATLAITNGGSGALSFAASVNQSWLRVAPATGTAPQSVQVSVVTAGLAAASYVGQVTITADGAQGSPAVVPVNLTISAAPSPTLSVSPSALSFTGSLGGSNPQPLQLNLSVSGGGSFAFSAASSAAWLGVAPASGSGPQSLQVTTSTAGLSAGTYSGQITITAAGVQGSPAVVPVSLAVNGPATPGSDWPMVGHDPARTGYAAQESVITANTVGNLGLKWTANVDGKVTAQPLFVSGVTVNGQVHDVVIAATTQNSLYAIDADTGAQLWRRFFGPDLPGLSPVPGGSGIRSAPVADRSGGRIFVVTDDGSLRTVSIANGVEIAAPLQIIDLPSTNKVRGGLNLVGTNLYIANGSNGGDQAPWRGRVYRVDVSGSAPVLANTFDVVPSTSGDNRGGGIWGYAGVTVDPATGRVFAATGADQNQHYTPYAARIVALSPSLSLLGSYEPPHPTNFACSGQPCDQDFGATPIIFQPNGCPTFVAVGNKSGDLFVLTADSVAASGSLWQSVKVNTSDDWLGNGGLGGVPAYWPDGRMLFITDSGPGVAGIKGGISAFSVSQAPSCTLQLAWSVALPALGYAQSSPSVAGGVVFMGEGGSGRVHAYLATTGVELWNSGSLFSGGTFAAPTIAAGKLFIGSWNGFTANDAGSIRAFAPGAVPPPPPGCTPGPCVVLGNQTIEGQVDSNVSGGAEAFQATALSSGTVGSITVYLDSSSTTGVLTTGVYADNGGHPGTLLGQGALSQPVAGAWNRVVVAPVTVTQGGAYWIAILGTQGGVIKFRDRAGGCKSESSLSTALTMLPSTWTTGHAYTDCPLSAYATP